MSVDSLSTSLAFAEIWPSAVGSDYDIVATLGNVSRQIRCGVGGTLVVQDSHGTECTIHNVASGESLTIGCRKVVASGSTAYQILVQL
jgi:hypothetical protein